MQITALDQIHTAEKRHYLALHKYQQALRMGLPPDIREQLKIEVCEAFAELKVAHEQLLNYSAIPQPANRRLTW